MATNNTKIRAAIKQFVDEYKNIEKTQGKIAEDSYCHKFWLSFLHCLFNESNGVKFLDFEKKIKDRDNNTKRIDVYIAQTRVIIEQKSSNVDLRKPQIGHNGLTPFEQAREYQMYLPTSEKAKWIVVSNFREFQIYNMDVPQPLDSMVSMTIDELPKRYYEFHFLIDNTQERIVREKEISFRAGDLIGRIYDAMLKEYRDAGIELTPEIYSNVNIICVRIVFCLYAEDAGMFARHQQFGSFLRKYQDNPDILRSKLAELFNVLNTPPEARSKWLDHDLGEFDYVNGGLFAGAVDIPPLSRDTIDLLINEASEGTDWSDISPTIFGAIFESTLNPATRRAGGMHYTSIENIHRVIDPLFMNDLRNEFDEIMKYKSANTLKQKLREFQDRISSLKFLDPACGSGNFLTESFISLRQLEDKVLLALASSQGNLFESEKLQVKVSLDQFYGIEINDFAVSVAKTALWIAEYQRLQETLNLGVPLSVESSLPLKNYEHIILGNALRVDWNSVVPSEKLNFIMGNPPFSGARLMNAAQKEDVAAVWKNSKNIGNLDYVTCWYRVAADYMKDTSIEASLVSTNSICQGEQAGLLWKPLFDDGISINNAYQTFVWDSEASVKAHVYCVIVQFSYSPKKERKLFSPKLGSSLPVSYINHYLLPFEIPIIESRNKPLCNVPEIGIGNQPIDGGFYLFKEDEMKEFIQKEPKSEKYFKEWYGADEFLNGYCRYCLWLGECSPGELRSMPLCLDRVEQVRNFRLASKRKSTNKVADKPTRFFIENMPKDNYHAPDAKFVTNFKSVL